MKSSSTRRTRRRSASTRETGNPQQDQKKDQKFFGPESHEPFFQPVASIHRAPEAKAEEKKEEKIAKSPIDEEQKKEEKKEKVALAPEEKKEESLMKAPEAKAEEKKEEKVMKAPAAKEEEKKEEKVAREAAPPEKKEEEKKVSKKGEAGGAGKRTEQYVAGIGSKGQPLPGKEQAFYGERLGYDFGAVRIHTGKEAAESARDAGAKAYTYGNHVVFNEGRYNPGSQDGRKLLAHELTHVVQQKPGPVSAPGQVHRQTGDRTATAAPRTTATDPAAFRTRLSIALSQMTTPTVVGETLSGTLEPVLREMGANAEWRDATGNVTAGAEVPVQLAQGGRTVRLRLVLDDAPNPPLAGRFDATNADQGTIRVYTRENGDADTLATTLYHESLHLMRWLSRNAPGGNLVAETGATGGRRMTLEGIDPARQPRHLAMVRRRVDGLATSVNAARPATDQIDAAGIDRVSDFMLEEYLTRVETEVFRLMRDSDAASRRPGASVRVGTSPDTFFPRSDVDKYLFEVSSVFRAGDRTALSSYDRGQIDDLYAYFRDRVEMFVRRRYSEVIHGPNFP